MPNGMCFIPLFQACGTDYMIKKKRKKKIFVEIHYIQKTYNKNRKIRFCKSLNESIFFNFALL